MKQLTYWIFFSAVIGMVGCTSSRKTANVTHSDLQKYADDTFATEIEVVDTYPIAKPSDYIPGILDTLTIAGHIFDPCHKDSIHSDLLNFYYLKDTQAVWVGEKKPSKELEALLDELLTAGRHGLHPADYNTYKLLNLKNEVYDKKEPDPVALAVLDVHASIAWVTYAYHLANGARPPRTQKGLEIASPVSVAAVLAENSISKSVKLLVPEQEAYEHTMQALAAYRAFAECGGWESLPEDLNLRMGDSSEYVRLIAERLQLTGDLPKNAEVTGRMDSTLVSGVIRFQRRHGLRADGILGKSTVQAYNVPLTARIHTLEMNLDRMRWLPHDMGDRYILINIPDYTLKVYNHQKEDLYMRVVVGQKISPTPIFREALEYLVFSPTWTVPRSIVLNEIIPHQRKNPGWLTEKGYKLYAGWDEKEPALDPESIDWVSLDPKRVNYRIVQNPGPGNALGLVKFIMPNSEDIYLHDTPADYLFDRDERAFSHGCIRLEHPDQLAVYLLKNKRDWNEKRIRKAMEALQPQTVFLDEPFPVYLTYYSAWGEKDGYVQFRADIYGYDQWASDGKYASSGR